MYVYTYIGKYRLRARAGWYYSVLIGESNVAIDPAIGGYGVELLLANGAGLVSQAAGHNLSL